MYNIELINRKGVIVKIHPAGSWRDAAAEKYGSVQRRLEKTDSQLRVELVDTTTEPHTVLKHHDQRWGKKMENVIGQYVVVNSENGEVVSKQFPSKFDAEMLSFEMNFESGSVKFIIEIR